MRFKLPISLASLALIVLALVAFVAASPINAQQARICPDGKTPYYVQRGDTAWDKNGGPVWREGWAWLISQNPQLANRQIVERSADDIFVLLKEGEPICGLEGSGLEIRNGGNTVTLPKEPTTPAVATPALNNNLTGGEPNSSLTGGGITMPWWAWLLISLILLALARWWWKFTHPATSGAPLRHNGVDPLNTDDVIMWTTRLGRTRFGRLAEYPQETLHPRLVGNIEAGVINGIGRVSYNNSAPSLRLMRNEPGFRAWFQMPNGRREQLVFLQGCGNDVVFSGLRYTGFTFTPTGVAATIPVQQPVVAPVPVPQPRSTFGLTQAREYAALPGTTNADCQRHIVTMRQSGVRITLPEDIGHVERTCKAAETGFVSAAEAARTEIEQITARLAVLHEQARVNDDNAANQRRVAAEHRTFLEQFIPPSPAPVAETAIAEAPAPERAVGTL